MRKFILCILVLLFCAAPLYAGMEPFYKGQWGMGMEELKALYQEAPMNDQFSRFYQTRELEYEQELEGQKVVVTYVFDQDLKLSAVGITDYAFTNISDHIFREVRDSIQEALTTMLKPKAEFAEIREQSGDEIYYEWAWLNDNTYADVFVKAKPSQDFNDYRISFLFYNNTDGVFNTQFAEVRERAAKTPGE